MCRICGIELKKVQKQQTEILYSFDKICRENALRYSIEGGTLLGAYKYQGFVPWDDDIDVVMLREDYEKFLAIASKTNNGMVPHTYKSDQYMVLNYCKYRMSGTVYKEKLNAHLTEMDHGLFIDIFPLDFVFPDKLPQQKKRICSLFKLRWSKLGYRNGDMIDKLLRYIPDKWIVDKLEKEITKYNGKGSPWVYEICNANDKFKPIPAEWFDNLIDMPFNGITVKAVSAYREYIEARFGDVSLEPPIEEQKPSHQIIEVELKNEY